MIVAGANTSAPERELAASCSFRRRSILSMYLEGLRHTWTPELRAAAERP